MENDVLTSDIKENRTLATVIFTDCVGFSARMSVAEDHTLDLIRRDLNYMKRVCGQYEGRVLKSTGDGLLMCFSSAVKAVECAVEIQRSLSELENERKPEDCLQHRIGIHLADIFITATDVMGNGVNIAARLQTAADPGGICISQTVNDVVKANISLETKYLGPRALKNIRETVPVYKILLVPEPEDPYADAADRLEQHQHLFRIKKLLYYACKNTWESDAHRLDTLNLSNLLRDLVELAPTRDRLKLCLDAAVKTLSKQAEYALIASIIQDEVGSLCDLAQNAHATLSSLPTAAGGNRSQAELDTLYQNIAQELEQTGNLVRIKKLVFYVCRRRWESDLHQLSNFPLDTLIAELHQLAPTFDLLKSTVDGFVQTLSKQAEYVLVANGLVAKLQQLYMVHEPGTLVSQTVASILPSQKHEQQADDRAELQAREETRYRNVAQTLEQDPNFMRIKKLMLYACRRQWESNPARLESVALIDLVRELHQLASTSNQLEQALNRVVNTLSKSDEYRAIAQVINSHLSQLYTAASKTPKIAAEPTHRSAAQVSDANDPSPLADAQLGSLALPTPITATTAMTTDVARQEDEPIDASADALASESAEAELVPDEAMQLPSLFDFRLGIMKYANPLRAKILIFSALHQDFNFTSQDWFNLKAYELDSLLRHLLSICKTYTDLEALLYPTARRLQASEEHIQTATAVIKCLRPFYIHGSSTQSVNSSTEETKIRLDDFEETTMEFASAREEDDYTRQILSSPVSSSGSLVPTIDGDPLTTAESQPSQAEANGTVESPPSLSP